MVECSLCKSSENLELEGSLLICTSCGIVIDEDLFENVDKNGLIENNSNDCCNLKRLTIYMRRELASNDNQTISKKEAKQMLDHCISHFRFTVPMKQVAKSLFIQLINSTHFYHSFSKNKIILSGVCAYLVMNKFDLVITKNAIAKVIGCTVFEFGTIYKRAMKHTKVFKPKFFTIDQHVTSTVNSIKFDETELPQIENIVVELINFQRTCCLIDSKFPINVILASSFYAWKCVKIKERSNVILKDFLDKFSIKYNLNIYVTKLTNFLIELCRLIPWISDKKRINRKTICFYIQDLLDYPNTIVSDYLKLKNKAIDDQIVKQEANSLVEIKKCKRENFEFDHLDNCNNLNWPDISDEEISSYIRDDEEIRIMKKIRSDILKT